MRLIDPACGSGHFLLGAFRRLDALWAKREPGTNPRDRATRVLGQVAGVDLNPFAVAIARFRLCVAALRAAGVLLLADAPAFEIHVATGDSLLHGPRAGSAGARQEYLDPEHDPLGHVYRTEDAPALRAILGRRYHVVVGNPPYITPKDKALNDEYRKRFGSCHREYSLAVPFTERLFDLAHASATGSAEAAGFVGMITANSFMKREFGKKLIKKFIPRWDLTHVVDTSGAHIPGHRTPTVLLFGRHRPPVDRVVRAVMGIRGEPAISKNAEAAAEGLVWSAIVAQVDRPDSSRDFVSVSDVPRERFQTHPWTVSGGGVAELKEQLVGMAPTVLGNLIAEIGFGAVTREDDAFRVGTSVAKRHCVKQDHVRLLVAGEEVRDWAINQSVGSIWPYDSRTLETITDPAILRFLWPWRSRLVQRVAYGQSQIERGLLWYEVFKQTAPVIKLPAGATEDDHFGLLGLLNSSTTCFWGRATLFPRGGYPDGRWQERLEWDGTKLLQFSRSCRQAARPCTPIRQPCTGACPNACRTVAPTACAHSQLTAHGPHSCTRAS